MVNRGSRTIHNDKSYLVAQCNADNVEKSYDPKLIESKWKDLWEKERINCVKKEIADCTPSQNKFVIVLPPPNVTGKLHLGHTLTCSIQDALVRWHKMCGDVVLWVPGTDHAGIATQTVVERYVYKTEMKTRHDFGREVFLNKVWEWKNKFGNEISYQLRRLGLSLDWTKEVFTMNPEMSQSVNKAFIQLFQDGLIYRDTKLVSWCPYLKTALSDIEVNSIEVDHPTTIKIPGYDNVVEVGVLWIFKYLSSFDPSKFITVATTRLETMLGDVAVAVNPLDERYQSLIGEKLLHPFFTERNLKVIADESVDMDFGTGAVKITPAHDLNDYELALKHDLPFISIFTQDGKINENGGQFCGLHRFDCRIKLEQRLTELNLFVKKEPNPKKMQLPCCSRSNDILEYMLLPQWWMNCQSVAKNIIKLLEDEELKIIPSTMNDSLTHWLQNIKNWCISRQLWWGHRIPAYKILFEDGNTQNVLKEKDQWIVATNITEAHKIAREKLGSTNYRIEQDEDVLDTWFSSSLFPFSVFGWPSVENELSTFFPLSLLETGHDILFFWVVRMIIMSLLILKKLPFKTVFLHAMIRDAHGKKMSKSLGNVIDPIEVIEGTSLDDMKKKLYTGNLPPKEIIRAEDALNKDFPDGIPECGTDALRYGLLSYVYHSQNINLDIKRVVGYRHFCNKLWNAVKFALKYFKNNYLSILPYKFNYIPWSDRWILNRLSIFSKKINDALTSYNFGDAVALSYHFWFNELCNTYLEMKKPDLMNLLNTNNQSLQILYICLDRGLRLLHPLMPFVTEELYSKLPRTVTKTEFISVNIYPVQVIQWIDNNLDVEMSLINQIVNKFRSLQTDLEIIPKDKLQGFLIILNVDKCKNQEILEFYSTEILQIICVLANLASVIVIRNEELEKNSPMLDGKRYVTSLVSSSLKIGLELKQNHNVEILKKKIDKKICINQKNIEKCDKKKKEMEANDKVSLEVKNSVIAKLTDLLSEKCILQEIKRSIDIL